MNIHLHNYEEYFVLYLDNELSSEDRLQVEAFVLQHPELKDELDILAQYKLSPDTDIVFPGKASLLKQEETAAGQTELPNNYLEGLILYTDDELNAGERKSIEQFIAHNPAASQELALLQRAKLEPEEILFSDKASLYRHEEKVPVLVIRWWKVAVAAAIILALGLTTLMLVNKKEPASPKELVNTPKPAEQQKTVKEEVADNKKEQPKIITPENSSPGELATINTKKTRAPRVNKKLENKNRIQNVPDKKQEETLVVDNTVKPSNNLPQREETFPLTAKGRIKEEVPEEIKETAIVTPNTDFTSHPVRSSSSDDEFAQSSGKKNKHRGFFRKLTRTFEKATKIDPSENDQVLIGGLAIKLK